MAEDSGSRREDAGIWRSGFSSARWIPMTMAMRDALADLEDMRDRGIVLTKEIALGVERAHGLTRTEFTAAMEKCWGFHRTRTAAP
jgi:hypothetical protein